MGFAPRGACLDRLSCGCYDGTEEETGKEEATDMEPALITRNGILVCGLNGSGKSTLGRALAASLGWRFWDAEDFVFPKSDPGAPYAEPLSRGEAERLLREALRACDGFVFASVKGDWGEALLERLRLAVLVEVPRGVRLERVRLRSRAQFGDRMLPGGDLEQREEAFFRMVEARPEDAVEAWLPALRCPLLRVDGALPPEVNIRLIRARLAGLGAVESEGTP